MIEVGRLCVKIAGRDARKKCVVIDVIDKNFVMIDGQTRRKRCNIKHLIPLQQKIDIPKNASHEEVVSAFKKLGIEIKEKVKVKEKEKAEKEKKREEKKEAKKKKVKEKKKESESKK
ncbi:50S ribosomal protein L14e [Candidatus Woesearchaeota archaeon]|nr:MAG: 50S ribosomal protein L14e [Candidatus Woesearchaeota archaeon]